MPFQINYKRSVLKDLKKIDKVSGERIIREIEFKISVNPEIGEGFTGQFKGLYKLRIGDWRVIYSIHHESILVLRIGHRHSVYK
ncbi:MAG: type II toxin-antitoxin system RelE/ParE family toxin [Methanospirillaceae archaeon]|nr:type II toxin-antitoxin system RelE/ParE family toxin [Methanospirillaceae archaeon]